MIKIQLGKGSPLYSFVRQVGFVTRFEYMMEKEGVKPILAENNSVVGFSCDDWDALKRFIDYLIFEAKG